MDWTGLDIFDNGISRTNAWLKEFMLELNWSDRRQAAMALCDVVRCVRDRLEAKDAVEFGNQLPLLIRGVYFEDWIPGEKSQDLNLPHGENVAKALFRLLQRKAQDGEIRSVESMLPRDLHQLWPHTLQAA